MAKKGLNTRFVKKVKKCKRCGNIGLILSNGLCIRCDYVVYGKKS